jgi:hypothetical protein
MDISLESVDIKTFYFKYKKLIVSEETNHIAFTAIISK